MGKRSDFVRKDRDFYATPYEAVVPLFEHLPKKQFGFAEPCAGDGALVKHIEDSSNGWCSWASDLEPQVDIAERGIILTRDYREVTMSDLYEADYIITNPPWDRKILHDMIDRFTNCRKTWLLFDADWIHTKQSKPYQHLIKKIVSIGRVKWIPGTKSVGKDNCCWYLFDRYYDGVTKFYGKK
jgi:hypothetical protein